MRHKSAFFMAGLALACFGFGVRLGVNLACYYSEAWPAWRLAADVAAAAFMSAMWAFCGLKFEQLTELRRKTRALMHPETTHEECEIHDFGLCAECGKVHWDPKYAEKDVH